MMPSKGRLVRMPVPPVRPLLRRTIKRFLRLLPSILLLLFVISLIFVTLMQIAVIHTHRRLQRTQTTGAGPPGGGGTTAAAAKALLAAVAANHTALHNSYTSVAATPAVAPTVPSRGQPMSAGGHKLVANGPMSIKKAEVLRIEALLDKNLPSIEANEQVLQNFVNAGRIRQIISQFGAGVDPTGARIHVLNVSALVDRLNARPPDGQPANQSFNVFDMYSMLTNQSRPALSDHNTGAGSDDTNGAAGDQQRIHSFTANESNAVVFAGGAGNDDQLLSDKRHHYYDYHPNGSTSWHSVITTKPYESKPLCPSVPPNLVGRVVVESHVRIDDNMSQIMAKNRDLLVGGFWEPTDCYARHRVAVIIPFRDRHKHLSILLYHLHPILRRQLLFYKIYVIEQFGSDTFNKGVLMNAGVREALKENDFHCFVFHDVDLIPEDDRNLYSCPLAPRHMSVAVDKFNYSLPYTDLVGGVLSISKSNFILVNGYSNLYWGWGGEDDDMAYRLKFHNLHIIRPPESIGRYTMIKHNHRPESPNNVRSALLRMAKRRAFRDGLGSVRYRVVFKHYEPCYTHIMVEIGHIHKWHFPSPNKLVLHFR